MVRVHGAREEKGIETENHKNKTLAKCIKAKFERKGSHPIPFNMEKRTTKSVDRYPKMQRQKIRN
jgi:hypothetical protein